ncbi:hypothetical protein IE077_000942 [Cardiosporidium cionae]|uniref:DRBM domain-containing protein n=1 Tax=Cardiosporidium cionae TaxID=476202 RepID=A0ABQ7JDQ1_9APIC|nr:hypothetical protein IE077_000942 [Cardiosporidium cionae]|eukprot:KAF8822129.1 hypothetical protein IE077_000942 [Cardiosporidium cionae]
MSIQRCYRLASIPNRLVSLGIIRLLLCLIPLLWVDEIDCGIAGFHKWFTKAFPRSMTLVDRRGGHHVDHVLFDLNQLLHQAAQFTENEETVILHLFRLIHCTLRTWRPRKSVVLSLDGSAPMAKLATQRCRRQKLGRNSSELAFKLNPLLLTPGTAFMDRISSACEYFAWQRLSQTRNKNERIYTSGARSPGEGELKLVDWINKHILSEFSPREDAESSFQENVTDLGTHSIACQYPNSSNDTIIVVGGDADLVLQALALPGLPNLYVYIPNNLIYSGLDEVTEAIPKFSGPSHAFVEHFRQGGNSKKHQRFLYSLRSLLCDLESKYPEKSHLMRLDYVFLLILNGNDYIPKAGGYTFCRFMEAYENVRRNEYYKNQSLIDANAKSFNWPFFEKFLDELDKFKTLASIHHVSLLNRRKKRGAPSPLGLLHLVCAKGRKFLSSELSLNALQWNFTFNNITLLWEAKLRLHGVEYCSSNVQKRSAQHMAAFQLLQEYFPEEATLLNDYTDKDSSIEEKIERDDLESIVETIAVASPNSHKDSDSLSWDDTMLCNTFTKQAIRLPSNLKEETSTNLSHTTPASSLNNLCLKAFRRPPSFHLERNLTTNESHTTGNATSYSLVASIHSISVEIAPPSKESLRFELLANSISHGMPTSKKNAKQAISMKALRELHPELYSAYRNIGWLDNGTLCNPNPVFKNSTLETMLPLDPEAKNLENTVEDALDAYGIAAEDSTVSIGLAEQDLGKVAEYLKGGIIWNLHMYSDGVCANPWWIYKGKYAPTVYSIREFIRKKLFEKENFSSVRTAIDPLSLPTDVFAALVMPNTSFHLLQPSVKRLAEFLSTFSTLSATELHDNDINTNLEENLDPLAVEQSTQKLMAAIHQYNRTLLDSRLRTSEWTIFENKRRWKYSDSIPPEPPTKWMRNLSTYSTINSHKEPIFLLNEGRSWAKPQTLSLLEKKYSMHKVPINKTNNEVKNAVNVPDLLSPTELKCNSCNVPAEKIDNALHTARESTRTHFNKYPGSTSTLYSRHPHFVHECKSMISSVAHSSYRGGYTGSPYGSLHARESKYTSKHHTTQLHAFTNNHHYDGSPNPHFYVSSNLAVTVSQRLINCFKAIPFIQDPFSDHSRNSNEYDPAAVIESLYVPLPIACRKRLKQCQLPIFVQKCSFWSIYDLERSRFTQALESLSLFYRSAYSHTSMPKFLNCKNRFGTLSPRATLRHPRILQQLRV